MSDRQTVVEQWPERLRGEADERDRAIEELRSILLRGLVGTLSTRYGGGLQIEAADEAEEAEEEAALEAELEAEDLEEAQLVADAAALEAELEAAPVEEPGIVDQALDVAAGVGTYLGQTFKGYATGAANMYLDYNNAVNWGVNKGLEAAGVDYRFADDLHIEPTSPAEYHAQNALEIASVVAGGYGAVKSAPAIARGIDATVDAARGLVNGNRATRVTAPGAAAATTTTTVLGDLRPHEIARIQAAADELGHDLYVVGSAAKGARRNVDTDLPLAQFGGTKAGTRSDIDYAVRADLDDLANQLDLPDVDGSWGVRGVDFLNLDNSPAIRFSPGRAPEFLDGAGRFTLD